MGLGGVVLVAVAAVLLWRQLQPQPTISLAPRDAVVVALGERVYAEQCASCHTDDVLFAITRHGVEAFAPAGYESDMPAYEGVLTDDESIAVLSYIKSTWPEEVQRRHDQMNAARP